MVNLCNGAGYVDTLTNDASSGYIRCSKIDVTSLDDPFAPTHLGYIAGAGMNGTIVLGLYSDDSGTPDALICQTASTAITGDGVNPTYVATTSSPSTPHISDTLWIGFVTNAVTVNELKGKSDQISPQKMKYQEAGYTYPTLSATFTQSGTSNSWVSQCVTAGAAPSSGGTFFPPPPAYVRL